MAALKLPKSTKINGERWRIKYKKQVNVEGEPVHGVCHIEQRLIEIGTEGATEREIKSTLLHEICHAIISYQYPDIDPGVEHTIIAGLERWLVDNMELR